MVSCTLEGQPTTIKCFVISFIPTFETLMNQHCTGARGTSLTHLHTLKVIITHPPTRYQPRPDGHPPSQWFTVLPWCLRNWNEAALQVLLSEQCGVTPSTAPRRGLTGLGAVVSVVLRASALQCCLPAATTQSLTFTWHVPCSTPFPPK